MAPSSANAIASGNTACAFASENEGHCGCGNCWGMPPKRVPMVCTPSDSAQLATAASATAIRMPGQCGRNRRKIAMVAMLNAAIAIAEPLAVGRPRASASSFGTNAPGSFAASVIPSRSFSWLAMMMTAMPEVNPTVTG